VPLSVSFWLADTVACVDHAHFDHAHRHRPAGQRVSITSQPATPTTDTPCVTDTCGFNNSIDYLRGSAKEVMFSSLFVCLSVCLSVCPLATLRKNFRKDLHEICREGWQWASEQMIKFWWRSRTDSKERKAPFTFFADSPDSGTDIANIAALVRRALAEVCTVPVLLVNNALITVTLNITKTL